VLVSEKDVPLMLSVFESSDRRESSLGFALMSQIYSLSNEEENQKQSDGNGVVDVLRGKRRIIAAVSRSQALAT
jgi:hypothetical protein